MAVELGYSNVYRDPLGFPEWQAKGFPTETALNPGSPTTPTNPSYGPLHGWAMVWTLLGIFIGGMALNLTPCVYPLIPITISYFGGRDDKGSTLIHALSYVSGIAVTNSLLGVFASLTGGLMGALLQNPAVLIILAGLLTGLALSLFGVWEIRIPAVVMKKATRSRAGYVGTLFMGLMMGIVAAPCIGPFILGLLTWVASIGSPWIGFVIFFTLSMGLGLPFFFLALFSGSIKKLPRSGQWMLWIRKVMGWILIAMGIYFIQSLLSETSGTILMAVIAVCAGVHLGWIDKTSAAFRSFDWIKLSVSILSIAFGIFCFGTYMVKGPGANFTSFSEIQLQKARNQGKPVIIDFSAQWCSPCREMDDVTFHDRRIVDLINNHFILIKIDLTRKGDPLHGQLLDKYGIKGVPTILFLDKDGKEMNGLRLVDFEPPDRFLERLNKAIQ